MPPFETRFWWPHSSTEKDSRRYLYFKTFVQEMVNRLGVGALQYGPASKTQRYYLRGIREFKAYAKTGNKEHLRNAANYAFLEDQAPSIEGAYMDNTVESATRKQFGKGGFVSK